MSQPHHRHVRFNVPMDTNEESLHVSSTGGETQQSMNFGFHKPAAIPRESTLVDIPAASQSKFNFGFSSANVKMPPAVPDTPVAIPQSKFNFGFLPTNTDTPRAVPVAPTATAQSKFNFGFMPTNTDMLPAIQDELTAMPPCKFNFGFTPTKAATPPAVTVAPLKFNFGFAITIIPGSGAIQLWNGDEFKIAKINYTNTDTPTNELWLAMPCLLHNPNEPAGTAVNCGLQLSSCWDSWNCQNEPPLLLVDHNLHLKGDEFDALARQMFGIVVGPSDELWQPTSPEIQCLQCIPAKLVIEQTYYNYNMNQYLYSWFSLQEYHSRDRQLGVSLLLGVVAAPLLLVHAPNDVPISFEVFFNSAGHLALPEPATAGTLTVPT
ncbi:hypothetical protein DFJ58DRAFT_847559 [Suillus subalutaceus]|uniref:uncharacterized protein n=1 Tax=Suillus subalutaceus TaxID=48586 RepID=UPI001B875457|nr:uncharacterized protein DFJ58DRAFT_847559 [Suillus subalutaceus]KAG1834666.1 hypothetical protein DFJ58DRAFT_847559 [Suillus subalutaceus]